MHSHPNQRHKREKLPVVESDRYLTILAAVRDLKMHSDPSPPNDPIHNSHVESAINIFFSDRAPGLFCFNVVLMLVTGHPPCVVLDTSTT